MALIDKASLLMVPSTYEAGKLYNVLPSGNRAPDNKGGAGYDQTRADFDFDRGSNAAATRIGSDGLIEKYRENLLTYSNDFSFVDWLATSSSFFTSGQVGYDGSNDAWLFTANAAGERIQRTISESGVYTLSAYFKKGTADGIRFRVDMSGSDANVYVNLIDGSLINSNGIIDNKITDVGNGWYRVELAANWVSVINIRVYPSDTSGVNIAGTILIQNAQLESGLVATDVLTSGATTAKAGVLVDMPRINFDANGENGALLLEPSRQQLLQYSEYFGAWAAASAGTGSNPIITSNYATSPDGNLNAARIQFNRGSGTTSVDTSYITYGLSAGTIAATLSVYLKTNDGSTKDVTLRLGASIFDYNVSVTPEWKRFILSGNTSVDRMQILLYGNQNSQTADLSCFGAQIEEGSYPTSYIPNHGTSGGVTRAADSCSVTGVSDVIGQTEGTLFWEGKKTSNLNFATALVIENGTTNRIYLLSGSTGFRVDVTASNTTTAFYSGTHGLGNYKIAIAYNSSSVDVYINGVSVFNDSSVTIPACQNVYLTNWASYNQSIETRQAALFNERLSNAELATLTTL